MNVGDLIKSNTRYKDQLMMVVDTRTLRDLFGEFQQIRALSLKTGIQTRWCRAKTWKVISGKNSHCR